MQTILNALRQVLGNPDFYKQMQSGSGYTNYTWDYGAMLEYMVGAIVLLIVISSVFKFLIKIVS